MRFGFWRKCGLCFRWFCRAVLLAVVVLVGVGFWVDRVGLPDFLKRRLVETLRADGIELQFSRMRMSLVRGLVADNVRIGGATTPDSPSLSVQQVELELNYNAALHRRLQLDGLVLRKGKFVLPLSPTNALTLDNIQTELRFYGNDTWSLDNFSADFAGAQLALSGEIIHAQDIRKWEILRASKNGKGITRTQLQQFSDALRKIHFTGRPQLSLDFIGDARDIHSFNVRLDVIAPDVRSPWVSTRDLQFNARLAAPVDAPTQIDPSWSWWTNLQPYRVVWMARLTQLKSKKVNTGWAECGGFWSAPELAVTNLSAELGDGRLDARVTLNIATREITFTNASRFDVHAIAGFLTDKTCERLADFSWTQPPLLRGDGSFVLPAWNRQPDWRNEIQPTLRLNGELAFTNAQIRGVGIDSAAGSFAYSNLVWQVPSFALAQSGTRLEISGSENDATKDYHWHVQGAFDPESLRPFLTMSNAARGLHHFKLTEPVRLDADVWGRLYDYDSIGARGRVACTNFAVRGVAVDSVTSKFSYANRVLEFSHPHMWRGAQTMTADAVTLDLNRKMISYTNGYSTADPGAVTHAIGPKIEALLKPYHYLTPPTVLVNGCVPLRDMSKPEDTEGTDMRFDIVGGAPFECLKLHAAWLTGTVHWMGETLILTNVQGDLYGGSGTGSACFDFVVPHAGADYQCNATVTNINLHALAVDLSSPTNRLEGALDGQIFVTHADTRDWRTLDGYGRAHLRDGLIWDIPIFGILSPVLNAVVPGLGNSRATDAHARFAVTNGVIYPSPTLEISAGMTRLQYSGTVDLRGSVNARVTAQLLHNIPGIGPVISTIFYPVTKLFEYKITGTLKNPKKESVYILPGILLMPLHPIESLQQIFQGGDFFTNSPSGK